MPTLRRTTVLAAAGLGVLYACTSQSAQPESPEVAAAGVERPDPGDPQPTEADEPEPCRVGALEVDPVVDLRGDRAATLAVEVAVRTHRCAEAAVVAPTGDPWPALLATPVALALDAPLLLAADGSDAEGRALARLLDGLQASTVVAVGVDPALPNREVVTADPDRALPPDVALAVAIVEHLDVDHLVAVAADDPVTAAAAATRLTDGAALLPIPAETAALAELARSLPPTASLEVVGHDRDAADALTGRLLGVGLDAQISDLQPADTPPWGEGGTTTWLVDPGQVGLVAVAAVAALARGEAVLPVDPADLRAGRHDTDRLQAATPRRVVLLGDLTAEVDWQLPLVLEGEPLPGGGFRLFDDGRRVVAVRGAAGLHDLVDGDGLDAAVELARRVVGAHAGRSADVLPAVTLRVDEVSSGGRDEEAAQERVEQAADAGVYVLVEVAVGDGRVLDRLARHEELLVAPNVGIVLVPASGGNPVDHEALREVMDHLAELTRREQLPQKLLVVRGIAPDAVTASEDHGDDTAAAAVAVPPELAAVVQLEVADDPPAVDGLRLDGDEGRWWWGLDLPAGAARDDAPAPEPSEGDDLPDPEALLDAIAEDLASVLDGAGGAEPAPVVVTYG